MTFTEILAETRRLVKGDSTSYPTADITFSVNRGYDRVVSLIREAEGRWQWDDDNNTDLPIATTALVANTPDYELDATHLEIERLEVMDETGSWAVVAPLDPADVSEGMADFLSTTGTPAYYDKIGNVVYLYPTPDYSQAASLKVYYKRGPSYFIVSDTTKEPGFASILHEILPLYAAYDFALINQLTVVSALEKEVMRYENRLVEHYSRRDRDDKLQLRVNARSYR